MIKMEVLWEGNKDCSGYRIVRFNKGGLYSHGKPIIESCRNGIWADCSESIREVDVIAIYQQAFLDHSSVLWSIKDAMDNV